MFDSKGPGERVDKTDANNVQVIHTCAGLLGLDKNVGTSDFYANGGRNQPGCSNDLLGRKYRNPCILQISVSILKINSTEQDLVRMDVVMNIIVNLLQIPEVSLVQLIMVNQRHSWVALFLIHSKLHFMLLVLNIFLLCIYLYASFSM